MAIDGIFFKQQIKLAKSEILNFKVSKINSVGNTCLLFTLWNSGVSKYLFISATPGQTYFNVLSKSNYQISENTHFANLVKFHLQNAMIKEVAMINDDRILKIEFDGINEIGDIINYSLYFEATGKFTNLIFVKADNKIIDAIFKMPASEKNPRFILPGFTYTYPEFLKKHDLSTPYNGLDFAEFYNGISKLLEKEIVFRMQTLNQGFAEIIALIESSSTIYFSANQFHFLPLLHLGETKAMFYQDAISHYFFEKTNEENKRVQNKVILQLAKTNLERNKKKLIKLKNELNELNDVETFLLYGNLLFTYYDTIEIKNNLALIDEYQILIDPTKTLIENGKQYFKKYKKATGAKPIICQQIEKTEAEINYWDSLILMLDFSQNILPIKEELELKGYLKQPNKKKKPTKNLAPVVYYSPSNVKVMVGLNHLQNDHLTFNLAKFNDTFFHVKDYPGSHVIVEGNNLDEATIRFASNIAAYYSKARYSSSVPVDYTLVKYVKKHPSNHPGQVIIKNFKTIFIDPEKNF